MTPRTLAAHDATLGFVQAAHSLMVQASSVSADLQGWVDEWAAIDAAADAVQALHKRIMEAPRPTGHDLDRPAMRPHRCMDLNPKLTDR